MPGGGGAGGLGGAVSGALGGAKMPIGGMGGGFKPPAMPMGGGGGLGGMRMPQPSRFTPPRMGGLGGPQPMGMGGGLGGVRPPPPGIPGAPAMSQPAMPMTRPQMGMPGQGMPPQMPPQMGGAGQMNMGRPGMGAPPMNMPGQAGGMGGIRGPVQMQQPQMPAPPTMQQPAPAGVQQSQAMTSKAIPQLTNKFLSSKPGMELTKSLSEPIQKSIYGTLKASQASEAVAGNLTGGQGTGLTLKSGYENPVGDQRRLAADVMKRQGGQAAGAQGINPSLQLNPNIQPGAGQNQAPNLSSAGTSQPNPNANMGNAAKRTQGILGGSVANPYLGADAIDVPTQSVLKNINKLQSKQGLPLTTMDSYGKTVGQGMLSGGNGALGSIADTMKNYGVTLPGSNYAAQSGKKMADNLSQGGSEIQSINPNDQLGKTMSLSDQGIKNIQKYENYYAKPYWDYKQWTSGYGTKASGPNEMIDKGEAMNRLYAETNKATSAIDKYVKVPLTQGQYDALTSFTFNTGTGWMVNGSTVLKKLNAGDYAGAAKAMKSWNKAGGKVLKGLVNRRNQEVDVFNGGQ